MQTGSVRLTREQAEAYLNTLETLAGELETATEAIIAGALPTLEESVSRQQAECSKLIAWTELVAARRAQQTSSDPIDDALAERILAASNILLKLNRRYSALLKHSGDTLRVLTGVSRSYRGQGLPTNLHTWSCDL